MVCLKREKGIRFELPLGQRICILGIFAVPVEAMRVACTPRAESSAVSSSAERSAPPSEISARSIITAIFVIEIL